MDWFFDQWVYGTYLPIYEFSHDIEKVSDDQYLLRLKVDQKGVPGTFRMPVPVRIEFGNDSTETFLLDVTGQTTTREQSYTSKPRKVILNPDEAVLAEVEVVRWRDEG